MNLGIPAKILQNQENLTERKNVWLQAWCSMATNNDIASFEVCTKAADACLEAYDERFNQ